MKNWFKKNYRTIIILSFLIPIITVAVVSITHVTKWYGITNPLTWAIYLSIGVEIAALSSLAAISVNMGNKVYVPFGIVTLIQFIGNIYFAYSYIDINSQAFINWVELVSPLLEYFDVEPTNLIGHKRFLSFFSGGMLPIISLTFLHMLVNFTQESDSNLYHVENEEKNEESFSEMNDVINEVSRARITENELGILEEILNKKTEKKEPITEKNINEDEIKQQTINNEDEDVKKYDEIIEDSDEDMFNGVDIGFDKSLDETSDLKLDKNIDSNEDFYIEKKK